MLGANWGFYCFSQMLIMQYLYIADASYRGDFIVEPQIASVV